MKIMRWAYRGLKKRKKRKFDETCQVCIRDVEAAVPSTASTHIASAFNRTWTLTEPGLYLVYELADKHYYQNQQLTIDKSTLLVKMIA